MRQRSIDPQRHFDSEAVKHELKCPGGKAQKGIEL